MFFQLRGLWKTCHQQLSGFATDLMRTQEARETAKHLADCEAAKVARLADVDERLRLAAERSDLERQRLAGAQEVLSRLTAFWHYFKRRRGLKGLESLKQAVVVADGAVGDLHAEHSAINGEAFEQFPASRSAPGATSIWPSSVMPSFSARLSTGSASQPRPRRPWRAACTR